MAVEKASTSEHHGASVLPPPSLLHTQSRPQKTERLNVDEEVGHEEISRCERACVPATALPADHLHTHTLKTQVYTDIEEGF